MERTFIMVKPEGVKKRLVGEIISRFEKVGMYLSNIKVMMADKEILEKHYGHLKDKPFFKFILRDMTAGFVVPMIFEGEGVVEVGRKLIGATNPMEAVPGSIRGDYAINVAKNVVHGSDSVENAEKEIKMWFGEILNAAVAFDKELFYE